MITNQELNGINAEPNASTNVREQHYPEYQAIIREISKTEMLMALKNLNVSESQGKTESYSDSSEANRHNTFIKTDSSIKNIYSNPDIGGINVHRHFVCSVQGKAVGIMIFIPASPTLSADPADRIGYMLTYPAGQGYGGLLIEHAVNLSASLNHSGILMLNAEPYSKPIYEHFGFIAEGNRNFDITTMRLTPANSNRWISSSNGYRLRRGSYLFNFNWRCNLL